MGKKLRRRDELCDALNRQPFHIDLYLKRAEVYSTLGYPDLAAMDNYKALLLVDEVCEDSGEFHDEALEAFVDGTSRLSQADLSELFDGTPWTAEHARELQNISKIWGVIACVRLSRCLHCMGCLQSARTFSQRALQLGNSEAKEWIESVNTSNPRRDVSESSRNEMFDDTTHTKDLPERSFVRRERYSWNKHGQNRYTISTLNHINNLMSLVAPKLEVRTIDLPDLSSPSERSNKSLNTQLGVFAKENVSPGEVVLRERSLLTANSRLHEPLCDACSAPLQLQHIAEKHGQDNAVSCPDCDDAVFCSQQCLDNALDSYHTAVCGMDVDFIAKEVPAVESADALYILLLLRALAMASAQEKHPLELDEVKFIWEDFSSPPALYDEQSDKSFSGNELFQASPRTLPFSFAANILTPLHILEKMDICIFNAPHDLAELWVWNTLYAKFRGTASARSSLRDGRPEVAAVHPLWCLANHSCDPNVEWEWAGEICFTAREKRTAWQNVAGVRNEQSESERRGGIRADQEVLNHYVDIDLPVKERREWGRGALGGDCMCPRCVFEVATT